MIIVSNTSPLINLSAIARLDLLEKLYGQILVPEAVWAEVDRVGGGEGMFALIGASGWVITRKITNRPLVSSLLFDLDIGESEAIALALEEKADLLLMDERRGRKTASRLGLRVMGLLGVLINAKRKGLVDEVKPILDALIP